MKERFKRYGLALFFLLFVSGLMVLGTMGVRLLGDKMIEGTGIEMKPRGEHLTR
ncbi:MAG: hypothetical protein WCY51_01080 [Sulfurimonas sp.]|uniref:hypothetical protein n=1 Tax=Sulfurimonas sp. TaxID=2022749 RepID=UPI0025E794FD|nr:hypothetical protein [Sulfurimonas sp.]MCK9454965.1 hypothetical protein [Sulfurimonas sp.]